MAGNRLAVQGFVESVGFIKLCTGTGVFEAVIPRANLHIARQIHVLISVSEKEQNEIELLSLGRPFESAFKKGCKFLTFKIKIKIL